MPETLGDKIVVAVSSRALFDFEEENKVYVTEGERIYKQFQLSRIDQIAKPGVAFQLVRKLLDFNTADHQLVEVVIVSHNDPISGLRIFKSAEAHNIKITRGVFVGGGGAYHYLKPLRVSLYLSANKDDVREALREGYPAARVYTSPLNSPEEREHHSQLRVAFDGDGVLFGCESQRIFDEKGLDFFHDLESQNIDSPLSEGPLKPFLVALHNLQQHAPDKIRTALITARCAPAHERAIRTLMAWGIEIHEAFFLGGLNKKEFLQEFRPDIYFDDLDVNCHTASEVVPSAHVDYGEL
jgi:5'-nucleotidase